MSYARLSDESDVYVFAGINGLLYCHWCALGVGDYKGMSTRQMLRHLDRHEQEGHKVPADTRSMMRRDALGNWVTRMLWGVRRTMARPT